MHFFFDLEGDGILTVDSTGEEFPTMARMKSHAAALLAEVAGNLNPARDAVVLETRVRDDKGNAVYKAVLTITGQDL